MFVNLPHLNDMVGMVYDKTYMNNTPNMTLKHVPKDNLLVTRSTDTRGY